MTRQPETNATRHEREGRAPPRRVRYAAETAGDAVNLGENRRMRPPTFLERPSLGRLFHPSHGTPAAVATGLLRRPVRRQLSRDNFVTRSHVRARLYIGYRGVVSSTAVEFTSGALAEPRYTHPFLYTPRELTCARPRVYR